MGRKALPLMHCLRPPQAAPCPGHTPMAMPCLGHTPTALYAGHNPQEFRFQPPFQGLPPLQLLGGTMVVLALLVVLVACSSRLLSLTMVSCLGFHPTTPCIVIVCLACSPRFLPETLWPLEPCPCEPLTT